MVMSRKVILPPKQVADDFGKRIAQNLLAVQVTIINTSKDKDLLVEHAAIDLSKALTPARISAFQARVDEINKNLGLHGKDQYVAGISSQFSSIDLELLQGVIQKGQYYDTRNEAYRAILTIGTLGAALVGVGGLGPVLPKAIAAWTGPGLTAFTTLFPDLTVDEVIRLNNQAYTANLVVPKQKSKVFVVFVPLDLIMDGAEKKQYWSHPNDFISVANGPSVLTRSDLSQIEVETQWDFIVPVNDVPPIVTDVVFAPGELDNFAVPKAVHGSVIGRFLDTTTVSITEADSLGLTIATDPAAPSNDNSLNFIITPKKVVPTGTRLTFQLTKSKQVTSFSKLLTHSVPAPTLTSIDVAKGTQKADVAVKLTGSGFNDGDVTILFDGVSDASASGIAVKDLKVASATSITATLSIAATARPGDREIQIKSSGGLTGVVKFSVEAAAK